MQSEQRVFVDANVLVYADDLGDAGRRDKARRWLSHLWATRSGRVSTQVLGEYYVCVTQSIKPGLGLGDARAKLRRYQQWQPWVIDHQTVETAWEIEARLGVDYWQALVVACAAHSGCGTVLSDALPLARYDQLNVLNPFETSPGEWMKSLVKAP